jgi:hypothetical protein
LYFVSRFASAKRNTDKKGSTLLPQANLHLNR